MFHQLRAFNPYWAMHAEALEGLAAKPIHNDVDYVQAHLTEVLKVLAAAPTAHLSAEQLAKRNELSAVLQAYALQGRFPINYYRQERIPVFIDEHDTHCAVGHLMQHSGHEILARRIAAADNYAWVRAIDDPDLGAWQVASGFSLDELKLIQGAYDFYHDRAYELPNKYEVPQKPEQVVRYFDGKDSDKVWCHGEGTNGDLHGNWVQNYSSTLPWIVGYFEHGKRSGRWKEYYKGTKKLCRTEHWRNDKLNGIRTRYDREGRVIETILFKDGQAVTKTNTDHDKALRYVRTPLDTLSVFTEVFTLEGALIAAGKETIHNPEGLSWFQDIELTALNTFAISARDGAPRPELGIITRPFLLGNGPQQIPGSHTLVQYRKEGEWVYYKDYLHAPVSPYATLSPEGIFAFGYMHFGAQLHEAIALYKGLDLQASYDSMCVVYTDDRMTDLFGYSAAQPDHLQLCYHPPIPQLRFDMGWRHFEEGGSVHPLKSIARLNERDELIGERLHFDPLGTLVRTETFLVPYKREEELLGVR